MLEPRIAGQLSADCPEYTARGLASCLSVVEIVNDRLARIHAAVPASQRGQRIRVRKASARRLRVFGQAPALLHIVSLAFRICYCDKKNYLNITVNVHTMSLI